MLLKDNIATSGLEDQYNDAGSCNSPRFVVSNYYLSEEHIEEEEEKEVHLKAQRDSNIPSNISLEIISSDIKASSDGNMDETGTTITSLCICVGLGYIHIYMPISI